MAKLATYHIMCVLLLRTLPLSVSPLPTLSLSWRGGLYKSHSDGKGLSTVGL